MLCIILPITMLFAGLLLWAVAAEYRPKAEELIEENKHAQEVADEFTIAAWNIGYAGMNAEMDYFLDGGKQVRTTKEQTQRNLQSITATLTSLSADFFLLQEVDENSKRSYYTNEFLQIANSLSDYHLSKAYNFKTRFVPIPITNPIGKVQAGLLTLSKATPIQVKRYAYPDVTPLPKRLFDLKRCFMVSEFKTQNGKNLYIINTHNSAFDNGETRKKEMEHLCTLAENFFQQGNYVVVGGDWNQVPPDYPTTPTTPQYTPYRMPQELLPEGWQVVYDKLTESMCFANEPYIKNRTLTATVDFFLVSPNVKTLEVITHNLNFEHSDHNPVAARFALQR